MYDKHHNIIATRKTTLFSSPLAYVSHNFFKNVVFKLMTFLKKSIIPNPKPAQIASFFLFTLGYMLHSNLLVSCTNQNKSTFTQRSLRIIVVRSRQKMRDLVSFRLWVRGGRWHFHLIGFSKPS